MMSWKGGCIPYFVSQAPGHGIILALVYIMCELFREIVWQCIFQPCVKLYWVFPAQDLPDGIPDERLQVEVIHELFINIIHDGSLRSYLTLMPGSAPSSGFKRRISFPPGPAARTIPSDSPKRIFLGARLATITVNLPSRSSGW